MNDTRNNSETSKDNLFRSAYEALFRSEDFYIEGFKLTVGGVLGAIAMLGYSYSHGFFGVVGVRPSDLGFGFFDYIFRGLFFLISPATFAIFVFVVFCFVVLALVGYRLKTLFAEIFSLCFAITFLVVCAISGGQFLAASHLRELASGGGRIAVCVMWPPKNASENQVLFASAVEDLSGKGQLRFIARNEEQTFLAVVNKDAIDEKNAIRTITVSSEDGASCSAISTVPRAFGSIWPVPDSAD